MDNSADTRGWGRSYCDAIDPAGEPCVLEAGHEGNHLTAAQAPTRLSDYLVPAFVVFALIVVVGFILPIPVTGILRFFIVVAVVGASLVWIQRR